MSSLHTEFDTYQSHLRSMLAKHDGQYVVIKGASVAHFSDTYEHALDWAYGQFGLDDFFVKKVASDQRYARDLDRNV